MNSDARSGIHIEDASRMFGREVGYHVMGERHRGNKESVLCQSRGTVTSMLLHIGVKPSGHSHQQMGLKGKFHALARC